jgi:hypothetical protein
MLCATASRKREKYFVAWKMSAETTTSMTGYGNDADFLSTAGSPVMEATNSSCNSSPKSRKAVSTM